MGFPPSFFIHSPGRPRLCLSLRRLAREVDEAWPDRGTSADGWIGDEAHARRRSDHNPDHRGVVHALDVTAAGIDTDALLAAVTAHPSTEYVIFSNVLYARSRRFAPHPYTVGNPHLDHLHISVTRSRKAETSRRRWWVL